jgi:hypothetical protein
MVFVRKGSVVVGDDVKNKVRGGARVRVRVKV